MNGLFFFRVSAIGLIVTLFGFSINCDNVADAKLLQTFGFCLFLWVRSIDFPIAKYNNRNASA